MFGLGLVVTAAYWPWMWSPALTPKFAALSVFATALLLYRQQPIPFTRAHLFGCLLVAWAAASVLWSWVPLYSLNGLWLMVLLPAVCFCLGSQNHSLRPLFIGAGLGLSLSSAVAIGQLLGWIHWPSINIPSGLFLNKNFMAEAAALVLIWLIAERIWWLAALVAPALALAGARGALLALGIGLALELRRHPSWLMGGLLVADMVLFGMGMATHSSATTTERLDIWQESANSLGFLGSGIGSYGFMPHQIHADGFSLHAHNDYLELVYELGVVGAILGALFAWELRGPLNSARLVLIVFAVEACFAFPSHLPTTLAIAALAAGYAVRDRVVVRRVAAHRRNFGNPGLAGAGLQEGYGVADDGGAIHAAGLSVPGLCL